MRLLELELKRIIQTRTTWILLLAILLLSGIMAYFPISFVSSYKVDAQGNVNKLKGREAIEHQKDMGRSLEGAVTEERIRQTIENMQEVLGEYGSLFPPEVPMEVYTAKVEPFYPLINAVVNVLAPDGVYPGTISAEDVTPEDVKVFYETYKESLKAFGKNEAVRDQISKLNENVEIPFNYYPGYSSESMDYLVLYLLLIMLAFALIAAPLFSAEYQTGADSILRCTKHGRMRLAVTKMIAAVLIFLVTFAAGISVFLLVTDLVFGLDGLKTSVQLLNYIYVIPALTVGQTQVITVLAGMLTVFAAVSCTIFLSARCRNVQSSLMATLLMCILPMIIYMMSSANLADLIRCILPTGGLGMMNSFLYELLGRNFVQIGSEVIWTPYLIVAAELVEVPVFLGLTVRTYCKREAI